MRACRCSPVLRRRVTMLEGVCARTEGVTWRSSGRSTALPAARGEKPRIGSSAGSCFLREDLRLLYARCAERT